jgi:choline dehydrogenase-like flavoprotein
MSTTYDVIVIGSGAGGAPVAQRLATAGMNVLMVERGKRFDKKDFEQRDEIEWCRRDRFMPSILTDAHTRRSDEGQKGNPTTDGWISVILGGGTVHMSGFFLRARPEDAKLATRMKDEGVTGHTAIDWAVPFEDIAKYYPIVEEELGVSGVEGGKLAPLVEHELSKRADAAAKKLGIPIMRTPRAILTEPRPDEDRQSCAYRLTCASYGCPNDARGSTLVSYIRKGEKTGKLTVRTETYATKIERDAADKTRAKGVRLKSLKDGSEETVTAGIVVLAASAIESARLLLLSGEGFNPGGNVGKNLWFSLYVDVNGWFAKDKFPEAMTGSPFIHRTLNYGGTVSDADKAQYGIQRAGALDLLWQHDNPIHKAERVATETGLFWGTNLKKRMLEAFTGGRTMLCEGFGESLPHAGAYIDLDPDVKDQHGLPVARITHFHHPRDGKVADALGATGTKVLTEMGATDVRVRVRMGETVILQGGTCRFSTSDKDGVTSPEGTLHGMKNVYVTDGGVIPSSLTSPSTETILANALRIADGILKANGSVKSTGAKGLPVVP